MAAMAITARGGTGQLSAHPAKPGWRDGFVLLVVLGASALAGLSNLVLPA